VYFTMPSKKIIVVNNGSLASSRARRNLGEKQYSLWGGGVTTVMSPTEDTSGDIILAELQCVPSVVGAGVMNVNKVKMVTNTNTGGRKRKMVMDEELGDPEEVEKRAMRRDRNRLAAAKCRKRRLDQIETLQLEVDAWEQRNKRLEREMAALRAEKEEMAFVLAAHQTSCRLQTDSVASVEVKIEPQPLVQEPQYIVSVPQLPQLPQVTQVTLSKPARPVSLALTPRNIEGVTIETPSRQILSFDTLMEGTRTGLTPTSLLSPLRTVSALNTPTCGAQHKGSAVFTPLFSPNTEATLLHL